MTVNKYKNNFNYLTATKYLITFLYFFIISSLSEKQNIFSIAVFASAIFSGSNILLILLFHFASLLLFNNIPLLISISISDAIITVVYFVYKKLRLNIKTEIIAYTFLSLIPFVFLGASSYYINYTERIISLLFTGVLAYVLLKTTFIINNKGLKYKLTYEEIIFLILTVVITGVGLSNFINPLLFKAISIFATLILAYLYRVGVSSLLSSIFGLSLSIYYNDITYVSIFLILAIIIDSFMPINRFLPCPLTIICDYSIYYIFKGYSTYSIVDFISVLIPVLSFVLLPTNLLTKLKDKLYLFREKQLSREAINRNRIMLSNKLYDLSNVFTEIANALCEFNKGKVDDKKVLSSIKKEINSSTCNSCLNKENCKTRINKNELFDKIIEIGIAKGKLSLIDFPKELCENCAHLNEVLYAINKLLIEYKKYLAEQANTTLSRELIKEETLGVAEILKGLAIDSGETLKFQSKIEREIAKRLFENGIIVSELLIYGEGKNINVCMIISMKEFSINSIIKVLNETTYMQMNIYEKIELDEEKFYLSFKISAEYDAVFGLSFTTKNGSKKSGDTHSVSRIKDDKFLVALSDGMGSGVGAEKISSFSLSLIETFYKAGLKDQLILTTVNKLLNVNCEDIFTALDVAVIDLKTCSCDFIKYGSPYGFIINKEGIKIVEGSTLPLGILEDIKPSVAHTTLSDGDMILLVTDGISDSFGSSRDMIDFIRTLPALNPQALSDEILKKALELNDGEKKDDMTALCVRVFKPA